MKLIHKLLAGYFVILVIFWVGGYLTISLNKKEIKTTVMRDSEILGKETLDKINRHIYSRYEIFHEYVKNREMKEYLDASNRDFERLGNIQAYINNKDMEWTSAEKEKVTPFMQEIINNSISKALRAKIDFYEEEYKYRVFGEVFVTNKYGANVAQTQKTSDYRQDDEEWWQVATDNGFYVKGVDYDESADMYSIDMAFRIDDEKGNPIGVMKIVVNIREVIELMEPLRTEEMHSQYTSMQYHLTTEEGKLIYSSEEGKTFLEDVAYVFPHGRLSQSDNSGRKQGSSYVETKDGHNTLLLTHVHAGRYKELGLPWVLIVQLNLKEIFASVDTLRNRLINTSLVVTLISIIGAYLFSLTITKNIKKLRDAAHKIGEGGLETAIDVRSEDEIGQLAKSFAQMTRNLKETTVSRDILIEEMNRSLRAEETVFQSEERFRTVLENATDAVVYVDSRGETIFWNKAAERIFGYSAEELVGKPVSIIIPEKYREAHHEGMNRIIKTGKTRIIGKTIELTGLRKDGTEFPLELSLSIWKIRDDTYFTAIIRDISERKRSEDIIKRQVGRLSALRSIDKAIISSLDLDVTLEVFLTHVMTELHVDAASILFLNKNTQMLEYLAGRGFRTNALKYTRLKLGESNAGRAAIERHIIYIPDLDTNIEGFVRSESFIQEGFASYFAVPLAAKGEVIGVLEVFHRSPLDVESEWEEFLEAIANQGAIALDNSFLFQKLQRSNVELTLAYDRTIEGWSRALDMRDKETEGHSQRVTELAVRIAQEFRLKDEELVHIRRGALLHDIGKMGIPDNILLKPAKLTDEEWTIMKLHPTYARNLLYPIEYLRPAIDIPYCHHEKWDGTGYPRGLRGEDIPLAGRIFAVVDVWDALCSDRPYRPAWPKEKVVDYITSHVGSQFDAGVIEVFLATIKLQVNYI